MTHVYIVHGFGAMYAFTTRKAARLFRDHCAQSCTISKVEVENSHTYGWGHAEAEALEDLARLDEERRECEQAEFAPDPEQ